MTSRVGAATCKTLLWGWIDWKSHGLFWRNFNAAKNGKIHFKGKSLEIIACGSLLFEPENSYLKKNFLKPGKHYISYRGIEDLIEKINYYKINPEELKRISENGQNELFKLFEKRSIWKYLLNNI
mgnify:CR=1 FL=1